MNFDLDYKGNIQAKAVVGEWLMSTDTIHYFSSTQEGWSGVMRIICCGGKEVLMIFPSYTWKQTTIVIIYSSGHAFTFIPVKREVKVKGKKPARCSHL